MLRTLPTAALLALLTSLAASPAGARRTPWAKVDGPSAQKPQSHGGYAGGCLAGAVALPEKGKGFETIRRWRKRYFGHPDTAAFLRWYGKAVLAETGRGILIGDISQARGGLMSSGHRSHQLGLDADIWFTRPKAREKDEDFRSMVDPAREVIDREAFTERQVTLLRLAASRPEVARIFVHWVIKHELCATVPGDRAWLRKIRPWWGHDRHFHIRLQCPAGSPDCRNQAELPEGDGCGGETWFSKAEVAARKRAPKKGPRGKRPKKPSVPKACKQVLKAKGRR
ncbi:MAG: penicillin-insensitive murein endopeptidase [Myxococcales bacterium]|nr:penicillin-insensitive murein endopeptidase [Myxococcales bacterium]